MQQRETSVNINSQFCVGPVALPASVLEQVDDKQQHDLGVQLVLQAILLHLLHLLGFLALSQCLHADYLQANVIGVKSYQFLLSINSRKRIYCYINKNE